MTKKNQNAIEKLQKQIVLKDEIIASLTKQLQFHENCVSRVIKMEYDLGLARAAVAELYHRTEMLGGEEAMKEHSSKVGVLLAPPRQRLRRLRRGLQ